MLFVRLLNFFDPLAFVFKSDFVNFSSLIFDFVFSGFWKNGLFCSSSNSTA